MAAPEAATSSNTRLAKLGRASSKPMSAEEKAADQALRKSLADREKERQEGETLNPKAPFPDPTNVSEEFEAMRWEMANEQVDVAEALSVNPARRNEVVLRKKILVDIDSILSRPRWACEKALKKRISELKRARYIPWTGTWETDWGTIELTQTGSSVIGKWPGGRLKGRWNGKTLVGQWQASRVVGTFEFTLADNEKSFGAAIKQGREKKAWIGRKKVEEDPK